MQEKMYQKFSTIEVSLNKLNTKMEKVENRV